MQEFNITRKLGNNYRVVVALSFLIISILLYIFAENISLLFVDALDNPLKLIALVGGIISLVLVIDFKKLLYPKSKETDLNKQVYRLIKENQIKISAPRRVRVELAKQAVEQVAKYKFSFMELLAISQTGKDGEKNEVVETFFTQLQIQQEFMRSWGVRLVIAVLLLAVLLLGWKIFSVQELGNEIDGRLSSIKELSLKAEREVLDGKNYISQKEEELLSKAKKFELDSKKITEKLKKTESDFIATVAEANNTVKQLLVEAAKENYDVEVNNAVEIQRKLSEKQFEQLLKKVNLELQAKAKDADKYLISWKEKVKEEEVKLKSIKQNYEASILDQKELLDNLTNQYIMLKVQLEDLAATHNDIFHVIESAPKFQSEQSFSNSDLFSSSTDIPTIGLLLLGSILFFIALSIFLFLVLRKSKG